MVNLFLFLFLLPLPPLFVPVVRELRGNILHFPRFFSFPLTSYRLIYTLIEHLHS
ncbi:hypothetical protein TREPR_1693 [Treponema primitia ZAS-2]|uniref:Uncharacterized protein n=1 Tax=Treponema primitia (strain ATCC BAA-887 / DSM 12427 / ZAS-2) TaxID=545694 RepID=F5YMX4_TREPZ|nr:hypothetical protein TREPR_1693 [Treponema primitia ZAS-2]